MSRKERASMEEALSQAVSLQSELVSMSGRLSALTDYLKTAGHADD